MTQPARLDEPRRHVVKKNVCAISKMVLRVQIYKYYLSPKRDSNPRMSVLQTGEFTASLPEQVIAEDVGFEPTSPSRDFRFSRPVPSTDSANLPKWRKQKDSNFRDPL